MPLTRKYTEALESLAHSTKRLAASEEKINALLLEKLRRNLADSKREHSRSVGNAAPSKQSPKK